jgi:hypothetical protein
VSTPDPDINERESLKALIESDGWTLFSASVNQQWGPNAQIAMIDRALDSVPRGDHEAAQDTVQQIRASARAALATLEYPSMRLAQLRAKDEPKWTTGFRRRA